MTDSIPGAAPASRPSRRTLSALAVSVLLAASLAGCGDDNPVSGGGNQPRYVVPSTPQYVLFNLWKAYVGKDSVAYDSLFAAAYQGSSLDQTDPTPTLLAFTSADEHAHIAALARSGAQVRLTLGNLVRYRDAADPPGWATIDDPIAHLEVEVASMTHVVSENETMQFKFVPTTPAPGSPTDTTWKIIRWMEVRTGP